jgi:hypothetical protein
VRPIACAAGARRCVAQRSQSVHGGWLRRKSQSAPTSRTGPPSPARARRRRVGSSTWKQQECAARAIGPVEQSRRLADVHHCDILITCVQGIIPLALDLCDATWDKPAPLRRAILALQPREEHVSGPSRPFCFPVERPEGSHPTAQDTRGVSKQLAASRAAGRPVSRRSRYARGHKKEPIH